MIRISMKKDRVILSAPYSPSLVEDCKSVTGATWSKINKAWSYPLSMNTLHSLRNVFGDELVVDSGLMAWAKERNRLEREARRLGRSADAPLRIVPSVAPGLAAAMSARTYQRSGARFAAVAGSYLLADEPGLGKTATSLAGLIEAGSYDGSHLVVAPKAALSSVWGRQIYMWTPDANVTVIPEGRAKREAAIKEFWELDTPRFLVVNLAMVRRTYGHFCKKCEVWEEEVKSKKVTPPVEHYLHDHKFKRMIWKEDWPEILNYNWTSVILDEAHEALSAYVPSNLTAQTQGLLDIKAKHKIALTGTPLRGLEKKIWGTLTWLGIKTGGYWGWIDEFFEVSNNGFGKIVHGLQPVMMSQFYKMLDSVVLRRTRTEVRPDLPLGMREDILLPMTGKQKAQYDEFALMGEVKLESGIVGGLGTLSELTRLKQMAYGVWHDPQHTGHLVPTGESTKLEWINQFLLERGVTGNVKTEWFPEKGEAYKYVISSQFTEVIESLQRDLTKAGIKTLKITGGVTGDKRTSAQKIFQSEDKEFRVMLLNTTAGGASIELDWWCDEMIIVDETFIADDQVQLENRINNRSGRIAPRTWWYLRSEGTIEEAIGATNYSQHVLQHELLDGRRGVKTALHLIRKGR